MTLVCKACGEAFSAPTTTDLNVDALIAHLEARHPDARGAALSIADVVVALYVTSLFSCMDTVYTAIRHHLLVTLDSAIRKLIEDDAIVAVQNN